jgi:hypothetical protein
MDFTSDRTQINLDSNGEEITFEGWHLLEKSVYDLWLSPCGHYLVQHYPHGDKATDRMMKTAYNQDVYMQDVHFRQLNRMGQCIGLKNWEYMFIHQFTGCHWYGREAFPEDYPKLLADLKSANLSWPNIRPENLYRNPEGELRVIGPYLCFEDSANPVNLNFWGNLLTKDEWAQVNTLPRTDGHYVDWRLWAEQTQGTLNDPN